MKRRRHKPLRSRSTPRPVCGGCLAFAGNGGDCPMADALEMANATFPVLRPIEWTMTVTACPYRATRLTRQTEGR